MKESFVFYQSFAEAMEELTDEQCGKVTRIIYNYALQGIEPENISGIEKIVFTLIKPQIDANNKRYLDGKKGGRPKAKKTSGFENKKPVVFKIEENKKPNVNDNVNVNVNVNDNENDNVNENLKEKEKEKVIFPFLKNYEKVFLNIPLLDEKAKSKIVELSENIPNFEEVSKSVFQKLKHVSWSFRDGTKPNIVWLLRDSNFITLANSQDTKKQEQDLDTLLDTVLGDFSSG